MKIDINKIKRLSKSIFTFIKTKFTFIKRIALKLFSIIQKALNKVMSIYCYPSGWQRKIWNQKSRAAIIIGLFFFLFIGIVLDNIWKFNYFYLFFILFCLILITALIAECKYMHSIDKIRALTIHMEGFKEANSFFTKYDISKIYAVIPTLVVLVFGIGGSLIYSTISFTPTFIWCLCFFAITVHISIIGYIQYVMLLIYIGIIAYSPSQLRGLIKTTTHIIPAEVDWLQELAKISHLYRNAFFSLGSLYIIAFACFCFLPLFEVAIGHIVFYILWGIIFIAIVTLFPIASILEFYWIKSILKKVKKSYINDLIEESKEFIDTIPEWFKPSMNMMKDVFASTINNSQNYPIRNKLSISYAFTAGIINLCASIATILLFTQQITLFT